MRVLAIRHRAPTLHAIAALVALVSASSCDLDPGGGGGGSGGDGTVSGKLRVFQPGVALAPQAAGVGALAHRRATDGARALLRHARTAGTAGLASSRQGLSIEDARDFSLGEDFVTSELILGLREGALDEIPTLHRSRGLAGYRFAVRAFAGPSTIAVKVTDALQPARPLSREETLAIRDRLRGHLSLKYVELNYFRRALATPSDTSYALQWHYPAMNLEAAWDQTTGSSSVVVAVVDDGLKSHPDIAARLLPGYDMISNADIGGDGDGRDSDASEVAFTHGSQSVWHGLHVAGTIGATSNNGSGVAGVDWKCKIVPVRVLGVVQSGGGAGTDIDILAGMNWAAGIPVPGVPDNTNPADVINLSLGGGPATQAGQDTIDAIVERGTTIVVAAGNENQDGAGLFLAGFDKVIVVGATDASGGRAPYSNYGSVVDVMAPGGNVEADANSDGKPDGVLSTYFNTDGTTAGYQFLQGTSMASPHVAGLVALIKAAAPGLQPAQIEQVLKQTADASYKCTEGCGAGLVNAAAALQVASGASPSSPPRLTVSTDRLNLGGNSEGQLTIYNAGGGSLTWTATVEGAAAGSFTLKGASSGQLSVFGSATIGLRVSRGGLSDGIHEADLTVQSSAGPERVKLLFAVGTAAQADVGAVMVGLVDLDDNDNVIVGGETTTDAMSSYEYTLSSKAGQWVAIAVLDRNGNGDLDEGDYFGLYESTDAPKLVEVTKGAALKDVSFALVPYSGAEVTAAPCTSYRDCLDDCGDAQACRDACPLSTECASCINDKLIACGEPYGCGTDGGCLCQHCSLKADECLGALSCGSQTPSGGGGFTGSGGHTGAACDAQHPCASPLQCDTSVSGGYCSRSCFGDGMCPSDGYCVPYDSDQDSVNDAAVCFARCPTGQCPRATDTCQDPGLGVRICLPP